MTDAEGAFWVVSQWTPDGIYSPAVVVGDDEVVPLDRDAAVRWAQVVLEAAEDAVHDAAAAALLTSTGLSAVEVAAVLKSVRAERPVPDQSVCAPFSFHGIVSAASLLPIVAIRRGDEQVGQWTPKAARMHAAHVAGAPYACDRDQALERTLARITDHDVATAVVDDLGRFRQDDHDGTPLPVAPRREPAQ